MNMTAVFATKISAFDPENISQRVLLTKERLYAIDQMNGEGRQQSFAASLLLEYVVKRLFPKAEHPLEVAIAQGGKPYLAKEPDIHFNLSHSGDWAVCAISSSPVGVDIQQCRSFKPNIADRFFHPDEVQYLSALPPAERETAFYTLWTLKESYVKADGRGLRLLRQFCVNIATQPPKITVGTPCSLFTPDFPDPAYKLGVCVQEEHAETPTLTVLQHLSTQ